MNRLAVMGRQAQAMSQESGLPMATTPAVRYLEGSAPVVYDLAVPLDAIVKYMADAHQSDSADLGALTLCLFTDEAVEGTGWLGLSGAVEDDPKIIDDEIRYPLIGINVEESDRESTRSLKQHASP